MSTIDRIKEIAESESKVRLAAVCEELDKLGIKTLKLTDAQLKVLYDHLYSAGYDCMIQLLNR